MLSSCGWIGLRCSDRVLELVPCANLGGMFETITPRIGAAAMIITETRGVTTDSRRMKCQASRSAECR